MSTHECGWLRGVFLLEVWKSALSVTKIWRVRILISKNWKVVVSYGDLGDLVWSDCACNDVKTGLRMWSGKTFHARPEVRYDVLDRRFFMDTCYVFERIIHQEEHSEKPAILSS